MTEQRFPDEMVSKGSAALSGCMRVGKAARSSTLLPFLYQTRTLQRLSLSKDQDLQVQFQGNKSRRAFATSSTQRVSRDYIPFGDTKAYDDRRRRHPPTFFADEPDQDSEDLAQPRQRRESTITSSEQAVFSRIFDDLVTASEDPLFDSEDDDYIVPEGKGGAEPSEDINSIFHAAVTASKKKAERKGKRDAYQSLEEHRKFFISRYPAPLREAAEKASGTLARQETRVGTALSSVRQQLRSGEPGDVFQRMIRRERRRELLRVEGLLKGAETDFQLWDVLEKEVFPMIKRIDEGAAPDKNQQKPKRGWRKKTGKDEQIVVASVPADAEETDAEMPAKRDEVPALAIVGPNYPSHCLLALRLLYDQFPTSPLALCLLPAIKRLGPTSYVLGASTALYNEVLTIQWVLHRDLRAMANLLTEMQEQGVDFDERTESLLEQPGWEREAARSGVRGASLRALWEMEEMKGNFARLQAMRRIVNRRLRESEPELKDVGRGEGRISESRSELA